MMKTKKMFRTQLERARNRKNQISEAIAGKRDRMTERLARPRPPRRVGKQSSRVLDRILDARGT